MADAVGGIYESVQGTGCSGTVLRVINDELPWPPPPNIKAAHARQHIQRDDKLT
mgnify:CR=1 FL=1